MPLNVTQADVDHAWLEWKKALFWVRVIERGECWEWTGARVRSGYGTFCYDAKDVKAHRVAWEWTYGTIPGGMIVLHKCDNPPCVRPDHLRLGTWQDNVDDMLAKGRRRLAPCMGSRQGAAKLQEAQIPVIRARRANGETLAAIATDYGVARETICSICRGKSWRHVK